MLLAMEQRVTIEIVGLHKFFEDWFTGVLPNDEATFSRVENALADGFVLISPLGVLDEREPLLAMLRLAYDSKREFKIWIENTRVRAISDGLWLVVYEEWQKSEGHTSTRLSTALFAASSDAPNGVVWQHVHETWHQQTVPLRDAPEC